MTTPSNIGPAIIWKSRGDIENLDISKSVTTSDILPESKTLFLFLDESGNFDFSENGTDYFIMTCLVTRRPFAACHELMDLKYDLFESGLTMKKFHATDDDAKVKSAVFDVIERHAQRFRAYSIHIDKPSLSDELKSPDALYAKMFEWLTDEVLDREMDQRIEKIIVITDDLPKEARRRQVQKPLKKLLKGFSERTGIPSYLEHFPSESDFNLQIVDYLCWAFMRRKAKGHKLPYERVERIFFETGDVLMLE